MPILFGGPNLNSIALLAGNPSYLDVIAELEGVTVPVKVVLEIFNSKTGEGKVDGQWTDSKVDKQCYKAGNTCEEAHLVCKAEFCEMDVWKSLIASFKAAGSQTECGGPCVTVLGAVDGDTTTSEYDILKTASGHADGPAWGASTLCTDFADTLCDGGVQQGSGGAAVDGFYFTCAAGNADSWTDAQNVDAGCVIEDDYDAAVKGPSVLGLGAPLFDASFLERANVVGGESRDNTKVNAADVYVTLAGNDLGIWNPFSWYPYVEQTKWAAIATERSSTGVETDVDELFDRGYGWVYLTDQTGFQTKSTLMPALLDKIEANATRRKRQARRLTASAPFWGCDDTLFECKPICMKKMGVVTTKVADSLCSAAPMDQCACKCFHEAQWTCEGSSVVCKAKFGIGELKTVGDKVCETRGAPKPASIAELRVASSCEPVTEMRGSAPTAQCLAQWAKPAPVEETEQNTPAPAAKAVKEKVLPLIEESFAATVALAALALYA
jgi:hypothetical protein